MKSTKELRGLSTEELKAREVEMKKELLKFRVQVAAGGSVSNPGNLKKNKKNIARIITLLKEKEVKSK